MLLCGYSRRVDHDGNDFWDMDAGTTEIRWDGRMVALVVVNPLGPGHCDERWALFGGGARQATGTKELLGAYPAGDMPPQYGVVVPNAVPRATLPSHAAWANLHNGSYPNLAAFGAAVVGAVASVYTEPHGPGGGTAAQRIRARADWVEGEWWEETLTPTLIDQRVGEEVKVDSLGTRRWFQALQGTPQIGRLYAEHNAGTQRRVHQIATKPGLDVDDGSIDLPLQYQGGTWTLARFLDEARVKQDDDDWTYTRGECTWHDDYA